MPPVPGNLQLATDWSRDGRFITFDTSLGEAGTRGLAR